MPGSSLSPSGMVRFSSISRRISPTGGDRYLVIRSFFTRQAQPTIRLLPPPRKPLGYPLHRSVERRWNTTSSHKNDCPHCSTSPPTSTSTSPSVPPPKTPGLKRDHAQDYSPFIRRLIQRTSMPLTSTHRPSKEELLGAASSWWERLRIRVKWFTIRGWRRFNTDDMSAFASWFVVGNSK